MKKPLNVLALLTLLFVGAPLLTTNSNVVAAPISLGVKGMSQKGLKTLKAIPAAKAPKTAPTRPVNFGQLPKKPAPLSKGGKKSNDTTFVLKLDNRSAEYVDTFVNNEYRGTIEPWGDGIYQVKSGSTSLFCRGLDGANVWTAGFYKISGTQETSLLP